MKRLVKKNKKRLLNFNKVSLQAPIVVYGGSSKNECAEGGDEFQGCQNPRGCGCAKCG